MKEIVPMGRFQIQASGNFDCLMLGKANCFGRITEHAFCADCFQMRWPSLGKIPSLGVLMFMVI